MEERLEWRLELDLLQRRADAGVILEDVAQRALDVRAVDDDGVQREDVAVDRLDVDLAARDEGELGRGGGGAREADVLGRPVLPEVAPALAVELLDLGRLADVGVSLVFSSSSEDRERRRGGRWGRLSSEE